MAHGRSNRGQSRRWPEAALRKAVTATWCVCFAACSGGPSDSSATSPSARSTDCSLAGPASASGVGCSTGCAALGGAPAVMLQSPAPWSSHLDPLSPPKAPRRRGTQRLTSTKDTQIPDSESGCAQVISPDPPNEQKAERQHNPGARGLDHPSKFLARRRGRFSQPRVRSTIQRLGSTTTPLYRPIGA